MIRNIRSNKGFTLIELLVVVAIIGILATAGIPQYRRMVAKASQSEAKVALGSVSTAQSAFFAEYGGYGNNLRAMGVQSDIANEAGIIVDAQVQAKTYIYGFIGAGCAVLAAGIQPVLPAGAGDFVAQAVASNNTSYGNSWNNVIVSVNPNPDNSSTVFGRVTRVTNCSINPAVAPAIGTNYNAYSVIASCVVKAGINKNVGTAVAVLNSDVDVWTVDQTRNVVNTVKGF